jgi:arabinosaccharide transport system permease protein
MAVQKMAVSPSQTRPAANPPSVSRIAGKALVYALLLLLGVIVAIPFIYMVSGSFKMNGEIFSLPLAIIPRAPTLSQYQRLLGGLEIPFVRYFANSLMVSITQTSLNLFVSSLVGWGFAKYEFRGKRILFLSVLVTLMFPGQVSLVPLFMLMRDFGWMDTYWAMILPGAISAFGVFFMRQTMMGIPNDLLDAARIDGSSEFGLYYRIALPLAGAGLSVLAVLTFLGTWNDYLWPLIVLRTMEKYTLPIGLASLFGLYKIEYGMILAGAFLGTLPILALFIIGRRQFIDGIAAGAVKG